MSQVWCSDDCWSLIGTDECVDVLMSNNCRVHHDQGPAHVQQAEVPDDGRCGGGCGVGGGLGGRGGAWTRKKVSNRLVSEQLSCPVQLKEDKSAIKRKHALPEKDDAWTRTAVVSGFACEP